MNSLPARAALAFVALPGVVGVLVPWDPPQRLVVTGVYGLSRNPMYVAVVLVLCGWALGFRARPLVIYAALSRFISE